MNWVDLLVLGLAAIAAVSGARQGMVVALPAFVGVLVGLILGTQIAPLLVSQFENVVTKVVFAVGIVVLLVALGETIGVYIGRTIKARVNASPLRGVITSSPGASGTPSALTMERYMLNPCDVPL